MLFIFKIFCVDSWIVVILTVWSLILHSSKMICFSILFMIEIFSMFWPAPRTVQSQLISNGVFTLTKIILVSKELLTYRKEVFSFKIEVFLVSFIITYFTHHSNFFWITAVNFKINCFELRRKKGLCSSRVMHCCSLHIPTFCQNNNSYVFQASLILIL